MESLQILVKSLLLFSSDPVIANEVEPTPSFKLFNLDEEFNGSLSFGWQSRYFSEGRDVLNGDSLFTSSFGINFDNLSFGYWYAISPEQDYDELQLSVTYSNNLGGFDYYFSFTHFEFSNVFPTRAFDNEVGFGISYSNLPYNIGVSLDAYYSFIAQGYFTTLTVDYSKDLTDSLSLTASTVVGMNQNYITDGHDGLDNWSFRLDLEYALSEDWALSSYLAYSLPLDRDSDAPDDDLLTNFSHSGVSLQWSF